jgi:signal transduction histidine kinase
VRPLDRVSSIRAKLGSTIVFAVAMTILFVYFMLAYTLRDSPRDSEVLALLSTARHAAAGKLAVLPPGTQVLRTIDGTTTSAGTNLDVQPPPFTDNQAHWGIYKGVEYVAIPNVVDGTANGMIYVMKRVPGQGLLGRLASTADFLRHLWWQLLLVGAASAALALLMARWLARGMTTPLREMARAARKMATGDYTERVETRSRDEVGQLAVAFNSMSSELENLEILRRELVANVSHELKTPISALRAHLENVLDGVEQPDPETLSVMLAQSERLGRLVDQLLDLSRLESGAVQMHREPTALSPLVAEVLSEVRVQEKASEVRMENEVPDSLPAVLADRERVHQVLFNLLDNAVRFTPAGGEVKVSAHEARDRCEITVSDTGMGISDEHLPKLFERFYRVDTSRSRGDGGTGIGLAIARSVVEAHGGRLRAESEVGRGSAFTFDLPVAV